MKHIFRLFHILILILCTQLTLSNQSSSNIPNIARSNTHNNNIYSKLTNALNTFHKNNPAILYSIAALMVGYPLYKLFHHDLFILTQKCNSDSLYTDSLLTSPATPTKTVIDNELQKKELLALLNAKDLADAITIIKECKEYLNFDIDQAIEEIKNNSKEEYGKIILILCKNIAFGLSSTKLQEQLKIYENNPGAIWHNLKDINEEIYTTINNLNNDHQKAILNLGQVMTFSEEHLLTLHKIIQAKQEGILSPEEIYNLIPQNQGTLQKIRTDLLHPEKTI